MGNEDAVGSVVCESGNGWIGQSQMKSAAVASVPSSQFIGDAEQSDQIEGDNRIVLSIRDRLERHPHFRGRTAQLQIEAVGDAIVLSGRVPTYYLKQLLQEAVKGIPDVTHIDNQVEVTFQ